MTPPKRIDVLHDASCNALNMRILRAVQARRHAESRKENTQNLHIVHPLTERIQPA
jgi:hypothetical protein